MLFEKAIFFLYNIFFFCKGALLASGLAKPSLEGATCGNGNFEPRLIISLHLHLPLKVREPREAGSEAAWSSGERQGDSAHRQTSLTAAT